MKKIKFWVKKDADGNDIAVYYKDREIGEDLTSQFPDMTLEELAEFFNKYTVDEE